MKVIFTIIAAIVIMVFVVIGFAIGRIVSGKNRLRKGCGMTPKDRHTKHCNICGAEKICEENEDEDD